MAGGCLQTRAKKSHHQIDQQLIKNNVLDFPSPLVLMLPKNQLNPTVLSKFVLREKWNHEVLCNFFIQQLLFCASELTLWLLAELLIVFNYLIRQQIQAGQPRRLDHLNGTNILLSISLPSKCSWYYKKIPSLYLVTSLFAQSEGEMMRRASWESSIWMMERNEGDRRNKMSPMEEAKRDITDQIRIWEQSVPLGQTRNHYVCSDKTALPTSEERINVKNRTL